jgi:hypothetical protein
MTTLLGLVLAGTAISSWWVLGEVEAFDEAFDDEPARDLPTS